VNCLRFAHDFVLLTKQIDKNSRRLGVMIEAEKIKTMVIEMSKETVISIQREVNEQALQ